MGVFAPRRLALVAVAIAIAACGSSDGESSAPPPSVAVTAPDHGCVPGELQRDDGTCQTPGVPPEAYGTAFESDGASGMNAILPAQACPRGQMAVPGERACREIAPCGAGTWGDIVDEPGAQYVDGAYAGGGSDGSKAKPWTKIQQAVDAARSGSMVAVAAGSYAEDVKITRKTVRLWGVCPKNVDIVGQGGELAAVLMRIVGKTELHDIAIRGAKAAVVVSSGDVVLDRVWIHDSKDRGFDAEDSLGITKALVSRSLVEANAAIGVYAGGSDVAVTASVVRDTVAGPPKPDLWDGWGLSAEANAMTGKRGKLTISGSLVERNTVDGVNATGCDVTVENSVIRDTLPNRDLPVSGLGVAANSHPVTGGRSSLTVRSSIFERNRSVGIYVGGSDALIESTVVRDTQPHETDGKGGYGISVENRPVDGGQRSKVTIRACDVERSFTTGIAVFTSDATIEATVVRDTKPQSATGDYGRGLTIQAGATSTIRGLLVERTSEIGLAVLDADAQIDSALIRDTKVQSTDGNYGDGLSVSSVDIASHVTLKGSHIERSGRAGLSNFGSAVALAVTALECNPIQLDGEESRSGAFAFSDDGGNRCGCDKDRSTCVAVSSQLAPPKALGQ